MSESDDDDDDHGGTAGIITTDPHQLQQMFFPYNSAGPFFLAFEDAYEEDEEDDVEDEGHEIFGADYADYEDLQGGIMPFSAAVRGSRTNLASLGGSTTTPIARTITPIKASHLNEEEEDEGDSENDVEGEDATGMILEEERSDVSNPKDIGEGVLDWKKSLARSSTEKKNQTNSTSSSSSPAKTKKNSFPTPFQFPTFPTSSQQMYEQSQQMYEQFQSALQSMASAAVTVGGEGGGGSGGGGKRSKKKGFTLSSMFRSSSNTSLQEVSSPYARFLRGYPEGAIEAFYYDEEEDEGQGDEDEDEEEEEGDEEENNDDDGEKEDEDDEG